MSEQGHCLICGNPLNHKQVAFCCKKCSQIAYERKKRDEEREEKKQLKEEAAKRKLRKKPKVTFNMVLQGMKETGLSYGEYVARYVKEDV